MQEIHIVTRPKLAENDWKKTRNNIKLNHLDPELPVHAAAAAAAAAAALVMQAV